VLGPLPAGVTAPALVLDAGATTGTLVLEIDDTAEAEATELVVEARATNGAEVSTAPVTLTIDLAAPAFDASWVESAAQPERQLWTVLGWTSQPRSYLTIRGDYTGPVTSTWRGLPAGVIATPVVTQLGSSQTFAPPRAVMVRTDVTAGATTAAPQVVDATLIASDGTYRQTLRAAWTIGNAPALDPAVGTDGRLLETTGELRAVAADLDSAGRLIVTFRRPSGGASYVRYTTAGAVDPTWGPSDLTSPFTSTHTPVDALVGAGDTVVTLGNLDGSVVITRMTADGVADPTLDGDGVLTVPGTTTDYATAIRIRGGKFVIAGSNDERATITRLNGDGTLDTTFDGDGRARFAGATTFHRFLFDADNRIVAVGQTVTSRGVIVRFLPSGELDMTFGADGFVLADLSAYGTDLSAIAEAPDGDLVVVARVGTARPRSSSALLRFTADGAPVTTFGTDGVLHVTMSTDGLEHVALDNVRCAPNQITAYGTRAELDASGPYVLIARYDDGGAPVTTFGTFGFEWILGGSLPEQLSAMRATPAGIWLLAYTEAPRVLMRSLVGL
jgi:uncharacterized delta-60 repeat protein